MPPTKICNLDVPAFVMIDATTPNSALDDAHVAFPNAPRHQNIAEASAHLLGQLQAHPETESVMLIGHGKPGSIGTGSGAEINATATHIGTDNKGAWRDRLKALNGHQLKEIIFCSCNTGADHGAQLVFDVAKATGAKTFARTGLITILPNGELICQPGEWQIGDPTQTKHPRELNPSFAELSDNGVDFELMHEGKSIKVPPAAVSSVSYYKHFARGQRKHICSLHGEDTQSLLGLVKLAEPFELRGEPLAIITGELELEYPAGGAGARKKFTVYNDLLLRDQTHSKTFYHTSPHFRHALADQVTLNP